MSSNVDTDHGNNNNNNGDNEEEEQAIVTCGTTKGDVIIEFQRQWSPHGYDRAVELFERGYYDESHFYRVVPKFLVQFGISYSPDKELIKHAKKQIPDDPQRDPPIKFDKAGMVSFAGSGPNSRTSQLFISYGPSQSLGTQKWETPVGHVIAGMDNVNNLYSYGDMPPWGKGPAQGKVWSGPEYIEENFPLSDRFLSCSVNRKGGGQRTPQHEQQHHRPDHTNGEPEEGIMSAPMMMMKKNKEHHHDAHQHHKQQPKGGTPAPTIDTLQQLEEEIEVIDNSLRFVFAAAALAIMAYLLIKSATRPKENKTL